MKMRINTGFAARGLMTCSKAAASGRPAFTLVEMLVTLAVFAIVSGILLSALVAAAGQLEFFADYRKAVNRAASVEAFLRMPAAYCGYGVPFEAERYKAAFGNYPGEPFNWEGPVSVGTAKQQFTDNNDRRADNALFIAYVQPGTAKTKSLTILDGGNNLMELDQAPESREIEITKPAEAVCKSFICFGSAVPPGTPLRVSRINKNVIMLSSANASSVSIQKGDRMRLFRAMTVFAYNDNLYTYDYSGSGKQPRLSGICDLRFNVDAGAKNLTAYVMTRGDKKYKKRQTVRGESEWPSDYLADSFNNQQGYLLLVTKIVLELPNCQPADILDAENIAEAF